MKWAYSLGEFEIFIGLVFVILYASFLIRLVRTTKKLGFPSYRAIFKAVVRTLYVSLLILALLGPSFGDVSREIKMVGKDIFFCLDLSQSMNAFDVPPSRLAKIKFELKNIVEAFHSDRIGLIMFSSEAYMQCPLTYDNNALNLFIQTLNTDLVPAFGTDFGPPLQMATDKLLKTDTAITQSSAKIIILISDGEDFGDETEKIAEEIREENITLFALGVGTEQGGKIPTSRGFKKNNRGEDVISQLNSNSLRDLAKSTGGEYFEINDSRNDTERLISAINDVEGDLRESRKVDATQNRYYYYVMFALFLMMFDVLVGIRIIRL